MKVKIQANISCELTFLRTDFGVSKFKWARDTPSTKRDP